MKQNRYFTVEEANALIPTLETCFERILQLRGQLRGAYRELERLGEIPSGETLSRQDGEGDGDGDGALRAARGRFRGLMEALNEDLQAINEVGVQVKDLDTGLCDFLGQRGGRDVFLCWRYGEKRVGFWHDLTTGFAGRQPIEDEAPRVVH